MKDVIVIGSGCAGCTAAIYNARAGYIPLVFTGTQPGGQLSTTTDLENFPGFPEGIQGPDFCENIEKQSKRFGAEFKRETVESVTFGDGSHRVKTNKNMYETRALIIASGSSPRKLGVKGEDEFTGRGVSTCATCDGAFFKDREVGIVGGGDSAMEEAIYLSRIVKKVYVIHRRDELRASQIMQDRAFDIDNIEFLWNSVVEEIKGDKQGVNALTIKSTEDESTSQLEVEGLFVAIGHIPNSRMFDDSLEMDDQGYVIADDLTHTNIKGVFASGDVVDHRFRQAITAAGTGCKAAIEAGKYLEETSA